MGKISATILLAWFLMTGVVSAGDSPGFYNDDKNYPLVWENTESVWYLNKNSIKVRVSDPPFFIINAQIVTSNGMETHEFFFDEDEPDMLVFDKTIADWRYLNPCNITDKDNYLVYVGEAIFYVSQGRKLYGNYLWKTETDDKISYADKFEDAMYQGL